MNRRLRRSYRKAFTLIELLVVLVILGVLAAIVVPKFTGRAEQSKDTAARTQIANFEKALDIFYTDNGRYPAGNEGLRALVEAPGNMPKWKQLMKTIPLDPWGNAYMYRFPPTHNTDTPDVYSAGPDGQPDTADDITNWAQ